MAKLQSTTPSARKGIIAELVSNSIIDSQEGLVKALKKVGVVVTQATASRDLVELGAYRGKDEKGTRYLLPIDQKASTKIDLLITAKASGNLAVLRTPPGGAQLLASALDRSGLSTLLGTIAGDDTVLAIASSSQGGPRLIEEIQEFLGMTRVKSRGKEGKSTQPKKR
jgi:transcriptional regulator of arginine metabolism